MSLRLVETQTHVVAVEEGRVTGTIGVLSQPGRVGLIFPPELDQPSPDVVGQLIDAALVRLGRAGAAFAQLTLSPQEAGLAQPFLPHGFAELTEAVVLERAISAAPPAPDPGDLTAVRLDPERDAEKVGELIGRINEGTLDCHELDVLRTPSDLLDAHRGHSPRERAQWWRYEHAGSDVGIVLGTTAEDVNASEILFFGVVPEQRGQGFGRKLLHHFVSWAGQSTALVRAGMDARNAYAEVVYGSCGFRETGRFKVWIHPLAAPV